MFGAVLGSAEDMETPETAAKSPVRQSPSLCAGEQDFVDRRKKIVLKSLNNLGINCTADSVPHIAFLASGGGQRAAVALVGSLHQLQKDGLLDSLLYLSGVSGSTWSMASLYSDPEWSLNMDRAVSRLSGPGVELNQALAWLVDTAQEESFSLSDVWGVLTCAGIMKQMDQRRLSDEASYNATNPYPVYSAVEKTCFSHGATAGKWLEMSPHEAGFTEIGLFVPTTLLGSKFQKGELLEQKPEMDMIRLLGVLGSALADEDMIKDLIPWLNHKQILDDAAQQYVRVYSSLNKLLVLMSSTVQAPAPLSALNDLQGILSDMVKRNQSVLLESKSPEEKERLFQQWTQDLLTAVQTWSQNLEDGDFKTHVGLLVNQVLPSVVEWEWGTTSNFLYQYEDSSVPLCLNTAENIHLIDAGLLINVGYPPFLGHKRDIDLIIAPEYSAGNMFETLTLARDYAAEVKKPFPEIHRQILEDREWPKDLYVLEGTNQAPTIVYMPLFNRRNCKDAEEFADKMQLFSTFQRPFDEEKIQYVLMTARENMKNNRETLLMEVEKAALRRQNKNRFGRNSHMTKCDDVVSRDRLTDGFIFHYSFHAVTVQEVGSQSLSRVTI
ncbi:cytosolic phospholipase A2 gamma [Cynoglossus semilaevis]|uniref:Phospholipase A2 group IVC n=1 Tax=Cynoglossus semilaevis TaxID=244447 RepID=A0A3P8W7U8_CYNSE|nr:cytosolic phospholipase A2 gamma [Cynoglossus semilaevis]